MRLSPAAARASGPPVAGTGRPGPGVAAGTPPSRACTAVVTSAREIPADEWAALAPNPYESRGWFLAMEEQFPDTNFVYLCAWREGRLAAVLPMYDRYGPLAPGTVTLLTAGVAGGRRRFLGRLLRHSGLSVLVAGSPYSYFSDVIGDPALDAELRRELLALARSRRVDLVSVPFATRRPPLEGAVCGRSVTHYRLDLPGDTVDDYLATFKSKSRAGRRKELEFEPRPVSEALAGHEQELASLRNVTARRNGSEVMVAPAFYASLAAHMGEGARVLLARRDGACTGAWLYFPSPGGIHASHVGVEGADGTYFGMFADLVRRAYSAGLPAVEYGPAAAQGKLRRGCRPVETTFHAVPTSLRGKAVIAIVKALSGSHRRGGAAARGRPAE